MVFLVQELHDAPFDIKDMQPSITIAPDSTRTVGQPLRRIFVDTLSAELTPRESNPPDMFIGQLLTEMADLKSIVAKVVRSWEPKVGISSSVFEGGSRRSGWDNGSRDFQKL
jgi:hypothetical protein